MYDVIAGLQVLEDARRTAFGWFDVAMRASATRQIAFGDDRQLVIIENAAAM